jgi:sortase (surface protein transpeptidase)
LNRRRAAAVLVAAGVAAAVGVPVAWQATRPAASAGTPPSAERSAPGPESPPATAATRPAAPATRPVDRPVRVRIPALDVDAPVDPVGVTDRGVMAIPERVDRVGWYRFGPAPGARAGSVVLAGHVDSAEQGRGALFDLRSLGVGERIDLVTAAGRTASYRVTGRETIVKRRLPTERLFDRDGVPRLVLITCGGPFDEATSSYRDNLVVAADPVAA